VLLHLLAGDPPGVLVCDDDRRQATEALPEDVVDRAEHTCPDHDVLRIGRVA
jgi:hypothetical protein